MRQAPSNPEIPDLEQVETPSTAPRAGGVDDDSVFEGKLDRSSLPPEAASLASDWAEFSSSSTARNGGNASTPPPRTSGFIRVPPGRESRAVSESPPGRSAVTAPVTVVALPPLGLLRALGPGLSLLGASALLTLVDQRTLSADALALSAETRPPTWVAGLVCIAGLCWLLRGLLRLAAGR